MPLFRYRTVEEMPPPERVQGPELALRIRALWNRAFALCPPEHRPGLRRYRSIEEANQDHEREKLERMRRRSGFG